jgi:hypothetical protein
MNRAIFFGRIPFEVGGLWVPKNLLTGNIPLYFIGWESLQTPQGSIRHRFVAQTMKQSVGVLRIFVGDSTNKIVR